MQPTRKSGRSGSSRGNSRRGAHVTRAQMRAMEARAAAVPMNEPVITDEPGSEEIEVVLPRSSRVAANRRRPAVKIYSIPRALEYTYIRADLQRLIITAAALLVMMIVLLIVIE